jgi:acyl-CoA thioesterase FadM
MTASPSPSGPPDTGFDESAIRDWRPADLSPHHYSGGHLTALAADELFFSARGVYFSDTIVDSGIGADFWLIYRHLSVDYLAEAFVGEPVRTGVRTVGRSRRSVHMQQVLQAQAGAVGSFRTIARARLVMVAFDVEQRVAVDLPEALWHAIQTFEGSIEG